MQTFFIEHIETPTGRMRIVTDSERRLRAADWNDHQPRMQKLLQRHCGVGSIELREPSRPSTAARALRAYFEGYLNAVDDLPTETNGTTFQRAVWSALRDSRWPHSQLRCSCRPNRASQSSSRGRPRKRRQSDCHRRSVPSGHWRQCLADRLRRRTASQAMAARARARGAAVVRRRTARFHAIEVDI